MLPDEMEVCHSCDVPSCVNPEHLFLGTHQENMDDRNRKGRADKKLTKDQRTEIRLSPLRQKDIAERYGVSKSTVCMIKKGLR